MATGNRLPKLTTPRYADPVVARRNSTTFRSIAALSLALLFLAAPATGAHAHHLPDDHLLHHPSNTEPTPRDRGRRQIFDAVVLRPLGFVQTLSSAAMFVAFSPAALATGTIDELTDICITQPVERTFQKPLGEF